MRSEFGVERTSCACQGCQLNCRFMPGFLIPADLARMIPAGVDPFKWAESNLLASPGAMVGVMEANGLRTFRIPTLVPAVNADRSCIHLKDGRCDIHEIAPFGCAFFDCKTKGEGLSSDGLRAICEGGDDSLYAQLWVHLDSIGRRQLAPERLREMMKASM